MAVYSVEGKLGTGKTKFCVWRAQLALLEGRRVASNVDLRQEVLLPRKRTSWVRLPDKPTAADLEAMGHGNPDTYDEERNGVLILDELGTWLNSRAFQDKERLPLIDWLIHARKHGWDVYLIVQDAGMIDKQVREALIEYQCRCMRLDKVKIPFVGWFISAFHKRAGYLPRMHMVAARVGSGANAIVAERWVYRGTDLHAAYDTRQVFSSTYPHGAHSVLPPWDWTPAQTWIQRLRSRRAARAATQAPPTPKTCPEPAYSRVLALASRLPADQTVKVLAAYSRAAQRAAVTRSGAIARAAA
jgi:hypothetical protein